MSIHVGDVGVLIQTTVKDRLGAVVNIGSASPIQFILQRPDGTDLTVTASLTTDGSDGKMQYATLGTDLSQAGNWQAQGRVKIDGTHDYHTTATQFVVAASF